MHFSVFTKRLIDINGIEIFFFFFDFIQAVFRASCFVYLVFRVRVALWSSFIVSLPSYVFKSVNPDVLQSGTPSTPGSPQPRLIASRSPWSSWPRNYNLKSVRNWNNVLLKISWKITKVKTLVQNACWWTCDFSCYFLCYCIFVLGLFFVFLHNK